MFYLAASLNAHPRLPIPLSALCRAYACSLTLVLSCPLPSEDPRLDQVLAELALPATLGYSNIMAWTKLADIDYTQSGLI